MGTNLLSSIFLPLVTQKVDLIIGWFDSVVYVVTDDKELNMKLFEMQSQLVAGFWKKGTLPI